MALLYEKRGKIAQITIDRPRALNSLDPQTFKELSDAFTNCPASRFPCGQPQEEGECDAHVVQEGDAVGGRARSAQRRGDRTVYRPHVPDDSHPRKSGGDDFEI